MVQETLQRLDGVATAKVNFAEKQAEIVVDDTFVLMPTKIKKTVRDRGYDTGEINVLGSGEIISRQGDFAIRFQGHADIPLKPNHLTARLAAGPQPVRVLLRVVEETAKAFKLETIQVIEEE